MLAALSDDAVAVDEVLVSRRGSFDAVVAAAEARGVPVRRVAPEKVGRMSGDARNDQGVVAVLAAGSTLAAGPAGLAERMPAGGPVLVLDGVTNPGNVGMILRTAVAFGMTAVVVPRAGSPEVGPLVVRASAGVALSAPVRTSATAAEAVTLLRDAGFRVYGLEMGAAASIWSPGLELPDKAAFVLGSETGGLSVAVDEAVSIPMAGGVESLNVAVAAGVLCAEVARRRAVRAGLAGEPTSRLSD